jgi:hypothetical protein
MNCVTHFMAKKMNLPKLSQEIRACAEMANRFPAPQMVPLYFLRLGSQTRKISVPKRRLAVAVDSRAQVPCPVKIIHAG